MTSKPTQPTARERMLEIKNSCTCSKGCPSCVIYKFLIALVEAAMDGWAKDYSKEYGRNLSETLDDKWEEIDQRLAEGES